MSSFGAVTMKLQEFLRKYYVNELIKGCILFCSLGCLYLFIVLGVEYFLWLNPRGRTCLFVFFISLELYLFTRFIITPLFRLIGIRKGISMERAAILIGNHYPEVKDKLVNLLQLKENSSQTVLLLASIEQRSKQIESVSFTKVIDYRKNIRYLKYAVLPMLMYSVVLGSGNKIVLKDSLSRVVNFNKVYEPSPAFDYILQNRSLMVIQGKDIVVRFKIVGESIPAELKIRFNGQEYFLQNNGNSIFSYEFMDVQEAVRFDVIANSVKSEFYELQMIGTPVISQISAYLEYPPYLGKKDMIVQNIGNLNVPEGTRVTWKVATSQTEELVFIDKKQRFSFDKTDSFYNFSKVVTSSFDYQISSSNFNIRDYNTLQFSMMVVKDEVPLISVQSNKDSLNVILEDFSIQISDDYGLQSLQLICYERNFKQRKQVHSFSLSNKSLQSFYYHFPEDIDVQEGVAYELFFEVVDNDAINGFKKSRSNVFSIRKNTVQEDNGLALMSQRKAINATENALMEQRIQQMNLKSIKKDLQNKKSMGVNDKNRIDRFLKTQRDNSKKIQNQVELFEKSLKDNEVKDEGLGIDKEEIRKRIEEIRRIDKQEKLLQEIAKLAEKLNKEDLVEKAKELAQQNKQQERSLVRTLELVKRFYIEQKLLDIANSLEMLSKEQKNIPFGLNDSSEKQLGIKDSYNKLEGQLKELGIDNGELKDPLSLPDIYDDNLSIKKVLGVVEEALLQEENANVKKGQLESGDKMKAMSKKIQSAMTQMQAESIEENMDDLRKILENLLTFSFRQEEVMFRFSQGSVSHPNFSKDLKKQNDMRTYFEHIDDSLYVLSMRLPNMSVRIQEDIGTIYYNLDAGLDNFAEDRFDQGVSNQRYVMTSVNNLSDGLSNLLSAMKNASLKQGKGKGKGDGLGFSLPDIIKEQDGLSKRMKDAMKKGAGKKKSSMEIKGKNGGKSAKNGGSTGSVSSEQDNVKIQREVGVGKRSSIGGNEDLDGELYKIYKEQYLLRQQLQENIVDLETGRSKRSGNIRNVLKSMEQLEKDILSRGLENDVIQRMQELNYELLKLDIAVGKQGEEHERESYVNRVEIVVNRIKDIKLSKQFFNQIEILNRQSLPLQQNYRLKVQKYFTDLNMQEK
jgi:hypothetical protein